MPDVMTHLERPAKQPGKNSLLPRRVAFILTYKFWTLIRARYNYVPKR